MKILLVNNHTSRLPNLLHLFKKYDVTVIDCDDFSLDEIDTYDVIILSGGTRVSAADSTKQAYTKEIKFIKKTNKPVIGICLGSQLIAKAFGAELVKLDKKAHGVKEIVYNRRKYQVFESHKYIINKLPRELKLLAKSELGTEIFKHKEKPLFGFQFHPEVFPRKTDGKKLFSRIIGKIIRDHSG